ncbi:MAG: TRAP transporter substrate-binding protein [Proteobacteria bacterium]|nr:TRAP transporter substrate-binding protein [Pseudomonadota bacterium]
MRRWLFVCGAIAGLALALAAGAPKAAEVTVKLAMAPAGEHQWTYISALMAKEIEKRVPGKVDWQVFPGGQLGKDQDVLTGLQTGTHVATYQASWIESIEPKLNIYEAPFLFANRNDVKKVTAAVEKDLVDGLAKKGIVLTGLGELGFRQISNNVRPIVNPQDLNGIKLRIPGAPFRTKTFKLFGANPTPMSFPEVYVGLRQGVIDGQENPLASIWGGKFHEVQKYISMANFVFTPTYILFSKKHWDSWPKDAQQAIREASKLAVDFSYELGEKNDRELEAKMKQANPQIQFNQVNTAAFRKLAEPLYADIEEKVGKEFWAKVLKAIQ